VTSQQSELDEARIDDEDLGMRTKSMDLDPDAHRDEEPSLEEGISGLDEDLVSILTTAAS
jgi:hypothetical protein